MCDLQPSLTSLGGFVVSDALQQIATQLDQVLAALAPSRRTQTTFSKKRDDFNLACYKIRLLLQYLKSTPDMEDPCKLLTDLVDITEMALLAYSVQFHPAGNDAWDPARGQSYWTVSELFHELDGYVETQGDYTLQLRMAAMIGALHCDVAPTTCPTTPSSVPSPDESTCLPTSAPMVSSPASTDYYSSPPSELEFWLESADSEISKSTTTLFPDDFTSDIFTRATPPVEEYFQHFYDENSLESASSTASSSIDDFTSLPSTASFDIWDDLLACDLPIPDLLSASSSSSISTSSDSIWNLSLPSSPSSIGWTANETSAVPAPRWSQPKANRSKPAPQGQPSRPLPSVPLWSHSKRKRPSPQGQRTRKAKGENKGGDKPPRKRQRKDLKDLKWLPLNTASAAGKENP